ncbi:MBL fold metallo-hydrolase [Campylobacter geochelonis]|uniref:MBL fold metallo-hydrolase n=1 Tax=Campylobacter geochelonis TaxID=1780362 RepID=UPI0007708EAB|nr:MBL fold metallo-hydrolase [Campylobacter geochelonis]CZE48424.1 metallo-beta-lactamase family protein [Campylobacter geochelonis]CZE50111.1 metallo-beta-lactamase family protein [Campylobacter geochelonis]
MEIIKKAFGSVVTNCYIVKTDAGELVIDPGEGSYGWIKQNTSNILAVLNTHAHYDHVFDDGLLQADGLKVYIHKDDDFMLNSTQHGLLPTPCKADVLASDGDEFKFGANDEVSVKFHHFAGHTPGCCMLEIGGVMFSGDFLFNGSIGRYDFPFSSAVEMKKSLLKALKIEENFTLYPGHGVSTTLFNERETMEYFLRYL